jgi:hypothetical protein
MQCLLTIFANLDEFVGIVENANAVADVIIVAFQLWWVFDFVAILVLVQVFHFVQVICNGKKNNGGGNGRKCHQ